MCFILKIIHCIQRAFKLMIHSLAIQLIIFLLLFQCLPYTWNELQLVHLVFFIVNVIMWFCLFHASTTDPGFLPRNIPEYDLAIKQVSCRRLLHISNTEYQQKTYYFIQVLYFKTKNNYKMQTCSQNGSAKKFILILILYLSCCSEF